mmetsp:Transcript_24570/g.65570  ORF Transcript_24570/g.65570 Transcript_24570/m.65570 type:complete len:237 (+) Transcript_24570:109-819(+)
MGRAWRSACSFSLCWGGEHRRKRPSVARRGHARPHGREPARGGGPLGGREPRAALRHPRPHSLPPRLPGPARGGLPQPLLVVGGGDDVPAPAAAGARVLHRGAEGAHGVAAPRHRHAPAAGRGQEQGVAAVPDQVLYARGAAAAAALRRGQPLRLLRPAAGAQEARGGVRQRVQHHGAAAGGGCPAHALRAHGPGADGRGRLPHFHVQLQLRDGGSFAQRLAAWPPTHLYQHGRPV